MSGMGPEELEKLKIFITTCRNNPQMLHIPELKFFKDYIESFGGKIPSPETQDSFQSSEAPKPEPTNESPPEPESEESDIELDSEGVIEEETESPPEKGDPSKEVSEDDIEKANEKRGEAMAALSDGELQTAVDAFTQAIHLNPTSAMLYAKRASILLKQKRVKAALIDCEEAVRLNPDSAPAFKFRGRTHRLLGNWLQAAADLRLACKLDFDEQASEWLTEVQPNAIKLEEHNRKYERKRKEKELNERRERVRKAQEAAKKAQEEKKEPSFPGGMPGGMGGMPGGMGGMPGGMGGMGDLFKDPEIMAAMQDPEVAAAFQDVSSNPANIFKYQSNPKISSVINKLISKFGGAGGMPGGMPGGMGGGMPGGFPGGMPGGFPGGMGGFPGGMGDTPPSSKNPADDLD